MIVYTFKIQLSGDKVGDRHCVLDDSFGAAPSVQALGIVLFYFLERSDPKTPGAGTPES